MLFSYFILEESQQLRVRLTVIPICVGVWCIVYGELSLNLIGFVFAFASNISSASRVVFYKAKLKETSHTDRSSTSSAFMTYLNVGLVSLVLYLPIYIFQLLIEYYQNSRKLTFYTYEDGILNIDQLNNSFIFLIYGSVFNFLYNLFSLRVLSNVAPISHSVINIMKRVIIVFCSMAVFSTRIVPLQWSGMLCADIGVFLYSLFKIRYSSYKVSIKADRKAAFKRLIVYSVVFILIGSCLVAFFQNKQENASKQLFVDDKMRLKCIASIQSTSLLKFFFIFIIFKFILIKSKDEIRSKSQELIPSDRSAHLFDLPQHRNYGDTLIW